MPVTFRIFPDRGLVYVRYTGHCAIDETRRALEAYAIHPDRAPGQKQLVDLSAVTSFDRDYANLIAVQARKADLFIGSDTETLLVYFAPEAPGQDMARMAQRSWDDVDAVVAIVQQDEGEALSLLGQPERSLTALLEAAR